MPRYDAIGFDLLTALLDTWSLWKRVAGDDALGMRWHAASQSLLRGATYGPFEEIVRDAAREVGLERDRADELLARWGEAKPWPDVPEIMPRLEAYRRFIVTNCSRRLGTLAASRVGARFDLVMTAEEAGADKTQPKPDPPAPRGPQPPPPRALFLARSPPHVRGAV